MKLKPPKHIFLTFILFGFTSCAAYQSGEISSSSAGSHYIYEDLALGTAKSDRILGLGGLQKDALIAEAKRQLMTSRPLRKSEEYINFTVDFKRSFILLLDQTKVTVTADVIRYTQTEPEERYSFLYIEKVFQENINDELFEVGDNVLTIRKQSCQILAIHKDQLATINLKNRHGEIITKLIGLNKIYKTETEYAGMKTGDLYEATNLRFGVTCEIVALGKGAMLVKKPNGRLQTLEYPMFNNGQKNQLTTPN